MRLVVVLACVVGALACGGSGPSADAAQQADAAPDAKVADATDGVPEPGDYFVLNWVNCKDGGSSACVITPAFSDLDRVYMLESSARFHGLDEFGGERLESVDAAYTIGAGCVMLGGLTGDIFKTNIESEPVELCSSDEGEARGMVTWNTETDGEATWTMLATAADSPPE